jgi:hypothetical protein
MTQHAPRRARVAYRIRSGFRHLRRAVGEEINPLTRPLDLARSRAMVLAALGVALAALLAVGLACADARVAWRHAVMTAAHLHRLEAVVLGPARPAADGYGFGRSRYQAEAAWSYPPGRHITGTVGVSRQAVPGSTTTVWAGDAGGLATAPSSPVDTAADAAFVGVFTLGALSVLVASGLGLRLRTLDRRAADVWERSWARVEPGWSGRTARRPRTDDTRQG